MKAGRPGATVQDNNALFEADNDMEEQMNKTKNREVFKAGTESNPFSVSEGKRNIDVIRQMSVDQLAVYLCQQGWSPMEAEDCRRWLLSEADGNI